MKHRRLFGLLSAAAVAFGSVPVLPVFAADTETPAHSSSISTQDGFFCISSKRGTEGTEECSHDAATGAFSYKWNGMQNGFYCYGPAIEQADQQTAPDVSYAGTLDLGDYGFYGVCGTVRGENSYANFKIIEGWGKMSDVRQRAGEKLGDITVDGNQYEVFRSGAEQESTNYWIISSRNQYDAPVKNTVEGTVLVTDMLTKLAAFGLPDQQYENIALFVDTGEKENGTVSGSADFTKNTYLSPGAHTDFSEHGTTNDGYTWWNEHAGEGMSAFIPHENGAFEAKWITASGVTVECGMELPEKPIWNTLGNIRYDYACGTSVAGNAFFGVEGVLESSGLITEFFIVDGWAGKRPPVTEYGEQLGTISVYGVPYDVYFINMTQETLAGTAPYLYQLWSVRQENALASNGSLSNLVAVDVHLNEWQKLDPSRLGKKLDRITAFAFGAWGAGSASVSFGINRLLTDPGTYTGRYCTETGTADGYTWTRVQKGLGGTSDIQADENGNIYASWQLPSDEEAALFTSGIKTDRIQDNANLTELTGSYTVGCSISGDAFFGLASTFMDISPSDHEPDTVECYVIDGWGTERPAFDAKYQRGTIAVDGEDSSYDVYLLPVTADTADSAAIIPLRTTKQQCMIVRQESKCRADFLESVAVSHDMLKIINTVKALGVDFPAWRDSAFFVQARSGLGSVDTSFNAISYTYSTDNQRELWKTGSTADGYAWEHWCTENYTKSVMDPGTNGKFSCEWENVMNAIYNSGTKFPENTPWKEVGQLRYTYELDLESEGNAFAGVMGGLKNYTTEYYIIDGWVGSELPVLVPAGSTVVEKLGTATVDGAVYDIYKSYINQFDINGNRPVMRYYSVRQENLAAADKHIANTVDVTAHLNAYAELGMDAAMLYSTCLFAEADGTGTGEMNPSGSVKVTKNLLSVTKDGKSAQTLSPSVKGDATCDGRLDISDAVLVARVVNEDASAVITEQGIQNGDVDGKKGLDPEDITVLLQAIAKKIRL
ncbi:MAG: glycoside hydrolase family 11 protein [Oscillospiraceae bacterium]|nr:glycoside hydrolase family 11 protein [Oscillospiraceae bacterium]